MSAPKVEMAAAVARDIRKHARSSMSEEICGVLLGRFEGGRTVVEASIAGEQARQAGTHVTFTQETWNHIHEVREAKFPGQRIVGWYHSHPGFGIFLSEQDLFIHHNFFSDAGQIAWVFDPHSEEEGCFAWTGTTVERLTEITLSDQPGSEPAAVETTIAAPARKRRYWAWVGLVLSHLLLFVIGFVVGAVVAPPIVIVPERAVEGLQK